METPKTNIFHFGACLTEYNFNGSGETKKHDKKDTPVCNSPDKTLQHLSGKEFLKLPDDKALLLDVRPGYEMSRLFDIANILYCPYKEIESYIAEIPTGKLIVVADATGLRSRETALKLLNMGFNNVANLAGGIVDWDRMGLPVTRDRSRLLTGQCPCQLKARSKNKAGNNE